MAEIETSQVGCPVCAGLRLRTLFVKSGYPVLGCGDCGLQLLRPQPDDRTLSDIYGATYFLGAPTAVEEERVARMKRATAALYAARLAREIPSGRVLELGCGRGEFLLEARERGYQVHGIEYSETAASAANRRLEGAPVSVGTIADARHAPASFDALVAADLIEHVRDPLQFLGQAWELLKPGGVILLVTPALDSLSARLLGRHWMEYKVEHLYYFGRRSLQLALERKGFAQVAVAPNSKVLSLHYVEEHFRRFRVPLLSPALGWLGAALPDRIAHRNWTVPASGLIATARKSLVTANGVMAESSRSADVERPRPAAAG